MKLGDRVQKKKGASWRGIIVGSYSTTLTPVGWAVESEREPGSVQIYPEAALELIALHAPEVKDGTAGVAIPSGGFTPPTGHN